MATDNDDLYDVPIAAFDDVTELRTPESIEPDQGNYLRMYDAAANTLVYTTTETDGEPVVALHDAADYDTSE